MREGKGNLLTLWCWILSRALGDLGAKPLSSPRRPLPSVEAGGLPGRVDLVHFRGGLFLLPLPRPSVCV